VVRFAAKIHTLIINQLRRNNSIVLPTNSPGTIQIYDLSGKLQFNQNLSGTADYMNIETALFPSGIYFIRFNGNTGKRIEFSTKIIISH
jgi:hypothetical protein